MLTESQQIRKNMFILEAKNSNDTIARTILSEGTQYNTYVELTEAPIGDVIGKIKSGIAKLPNQAKQKIVPVIKSLPKAALPMVAAAIISATSGTDAQAQSVDFSALQQQLNQISQNVEKIGNTADTEYNRVKSQYTTPEWSDKDDNEMKQYFNYVWNATGEKINYWEDSTRNYLNAMERADTPESQKYEKQLNNIIRYKRDGFTKSDMSFVRQFIIRSPEQVIKFVTDNNLNDTETGKRIIKTANKYIK